MKLWKRDTTAWTVRQVEAEPYPGKDEDGDTCYTNTHFAREAMSAPAWTEGAIARAISLQTLARKCVVLVDRCSLTGHECDVLAVTTDLRIIYIEIKISRSDFKADAKKDKWWFSLSYEQAQARGVDFWSHREPRDWPPKVWKHYYAMPSEIWTPELADAMPSTTSGVLLVRRRRGYDSHGQQLIEVNCVRRACPNKHADRLQSGQVIDIARLANLRMWEAYKQRDEAKRERTAA